MKTRIVNEVMFPAVYLGYREEQALRLFTTPGTLHVLEDVGMDVSNARKTVLRLMEKGLVARVRAKREGNRGQPPWIYRSLRSSF